MSDRTLLTVQQVIKELKKLDDWFVFGVALDVPVSELRKIESSCPRGSVERCKIETIQYWLDNTSDASWNELAQALELIDQLVLAAAVKHKYLWRTCEQEDEESPTKGDILSFPTTTDTTQQSIPLTTAPLAHSLNPPNPLLSSDGNGFESEVYANASVVRQLLNLKGFFSRMLSNVRDIFAKCDLSKAQFFLDVFNSTEEYSKCDSFDKILRLLLQQNVLDVFNIDILQQLVACFNDDKLTAVVEAYEAEKEKFLQDTAVLEFQRAVVSSVEPVLPSGRAMVTIKIPRRLARLLTMRDIEELALEGFQECHKSLVRLHAMPGSVVIMWFIPMDLITKLEQLVHKNAAIFSAKGVEEVTVNGTKVLPVPQFKAIPKLLQVSGVENRTLKQVYTDFYPQLVEAVSDTHTCQSLTAQLHSTTLISQEKITQLSSGRDTGGRYLRVLGLEDEPHLLIVLMEKMAGMEQLQKLVEKMSTCLTESQQDQRKEKEQGRVDQLTIDKKELIFQLQCCKEDLKRANELLILREKTISAMLRKNQKTVTSVEQLKEDVIRLQLHQTDCSDVAVQTEDEYMIQLHHTDCSDVAVQTDEEFSPDSKYQKAYTPGHYSKHMNLGSINFGQLYPFTYLPLEVRSATLARGRPLITPDHSSDIGELLDIDQLLTSQHRPPPTHQSLPFQETPSCDPNPEEFFRCSMLCQNGERVIEVSVNTELSSIMKETACNALLHCRNLCEQYKEQVDKPCYLHVAMHNKARVCNFRLDTWAMKLIFIMPEDCVRIEDWLEQNPSCDICDCQLILQQVVNTLATLFQNPDHTITFWGSYQIWVAKDMQVYLYIDCSSSLAVQKKYARLPQVNPRSEDIVVLSQLYQRVLKPHIDKGLNWASHALREQFNLFEQHMANPFRCVSQMLQFANLLGGRRICKLTTQFTKDKHLLTYLVYCLEHEPIGDALDCIRQVLPASQHSWTVRWTQREYRPVESDTVVSQIQDQLTLTLHPALIMRDPRVLYLQSSYTD